MGKVNSSSNISIQQGAPDYLVHVKCKCGKELKITGKDWVIDFRGDVFFQCKCGGTQSIMVPNLALLVLENIPPQTLPLLIGLDPELNKLIAAVLNKESTK